METFLTEYSIYVVLLVTLAVWFGVAYYLFRLERRVSELERDSATKRRAEEERGG
jgi:CcmD family protein